MTCTCRDRDPRGFGPNPDCPLDGDADRLTVRAAIVAEDFDRVASELDTIRDRVILAGDLAGGPDPDHLHAAVDALRTAADAIHHVLHQHQHHLTTGA